MKQLNFIYMVLAISLGLNAFLTYSNGELRDAISRSIGHLNRSSDILEETTANLVMTTEGWEECTDSFKKSNDVLEVTTDKMKKHLDVLGVQGTTLSESPTVNETGWASSGFTWSQKPLGRIPKSEACYVGLNEKGKSIYHVRGFGFAVIIAKSLGWTKSSKGSITLVQNEPLDWSKYGNCAD